MEEKRRFDFEFKDFDSYREFKSDAICIIEYMYRRFVHKILKNPEFKNMITKNILKNIEKNVDILVERAIEKRFGVIEKNLGIQKTRSLILEDYIRKIVYSKGFINTLKKSMGLFKNQRINGEIKYGKNTKS